MQRDLSQVDDRPAPFSTAECDLRGLEWMPLNAANLLDSDLFLLSTGDEFKAAMALICKSWRQVPAGSLPNDDGALATLSGARDWTMVRTMALRNWVLCSDGRLYHPVVAEKAMEALPHREEFIAKKTAEAERKERERRDRKELFAKLREAGFVLPYDTKTTELRERVAKLGQAGDNPSNPAVERDIDRDDLSRGNRDLSRLGHHTTPPDTTGIPSSPVTTTGESPPPGGDAHAGGDPFELSGDVTADDVPKTSLPCPHMAILKLWAEVLPELPQHDPHEWNDARRAMLQRRWKERAARRGWPDQAAGLAEFQRLFQWIRLSPYLMGQVEQRDRNRRPFVLELEWLIRPTNWSKVLEGKYHESKKE